MKTTLIKYHDAVGEVIKIVDRAKVNIMKHYKDVDDWSGLDVLIHERCSVSGPTEVKQVWYGPGPFKFGKDLYETEREKVETMECVLDDCDRDFSVTINGTTWFWISNAPTMMIWDYIEKELKL